MTFCRRPQSRFRKEGLGKTPRGWTCSSGGFHYLLFCARVRLEEAIAPRVLVRTYSTVLNVQYYVPYVGYRYGTPSTAQLIARSRAARRSAGEKRECYYVVDTSTVQHGSIGMYVPVLYQSTGILLDCFMILPLSSSSQLKSYKAFSSPFCVVPSNLFATFCCVFSHL